MQKTHAVFFVLAPFLLPPSLVPWQVWLIWSGAHWDPVDCWPPVLPLGLHLVPLHEKSITCYFCFPISHFKPECLLKPDISIYFAGIIFGLRYGKDGAFMECNNIINSHTAMMRMLGGSLHVPREGNNTVLRVICQSQGHGANSSLANEVGCSCL